MKDEMSKETMRTAGILVLALPTVVLGGTSLLRLLITDPSYTANPLRQDLWRAGHAHAGVLLLLSLVALLWVDRARLGEGSKVLVRTLLPASALLLPAAFFLSVLDPEASEPNALIHLAWVGAGTMGVGLFLLGVGLLRASTQPPGPDRRRRAD